MSISMTEIKVYKKFDVLAKDVLDLAKEILPDKLIYLNAFEENQQITLKLSDNNTKIKLEEGTIFDISEGICNLVDFENNRPLVYEDVTKVEALTNIQQTLKAVNINAYLGIPIRYKNGERFGTLCAADYKVSTFDDNSIKMLQKIANMFSYYLELERIAYRDLLTELYNRQYLYRFFDEMAEMGGVLFFMDLDGFKGVNDQHGHDCGDEVLKEVGHKLDAFVSKYHESIAIRLGGDEFIVLMPYPLLTSDVKKHVKALLESFRSWKTDIGQIKLSASIGVVNYPEGYNQGLKSLLTAADKALYNAKLKGKNTYHF